MKGIRNREVAVMLLLVQRSRERPLFLCPFYQAVTPLLERGRLCLRSLELGTPCEGRSERGWAGRSERYWPAGGAVGMRRRPLGWAGAGAWGCCAGRGDWGAEGRGACGRLPRGSLGARANSLLRWGSTWL